MESAPCKVNRSDSAWLREVDGALAALAGGLRWVVAAAGSVDKERL